VKVLVNDRNKAVTLENDEPDAFGERKLDIGADLYPTRRYQIHWPDIEAFGFGAKR
jgi:hypothetical protein